MNGRVESILYRLIRAQQEAVNNAIKCNETGEGNDNSILVSDADYLLFDPNTGKVLTESRFNAFLSATILNHRIHDAKGSFPVITSHSFRHVSIGERLRSDFYSAEQTMKEANHSDLDMTLSYGYMSEKR